MTIHSGQDDKDVTAKNGQCVVSWSVIALITAAVFFWLMQLPYLAKGGLIVDDWGAVYSACKIKGLWATYLSWFPLFSNRPLAPVPITLVTHLAVLHFRVYPWVHVLVWFTATFIFSRVLWHRFGIRSACVFLVFAAMPVISPAYAFSPINMLVASVAFLFWSLAMFSLDRHLETGERGYYYLCYLLVLMGLLTYEVILPLLVWMILYPSLTGVGERQGKRIKLIVVYIFRYVMPVICVCAAIYLWQKSIAPHYFTTVDSRCAFSLNAESFRVALWTAKTWFYAIRYHLPFLFRRSCIYPLTGYTCLCMGAFLAALFFCAHRKNGNVRTSGHRLPVLLASLLTLLACSGIYFLSCNNAQVSGYESRGLSSTWMAIALSLSAMVRFHRFLVVLAAIIGLFCVHSFAIQRDHYIESWGLQRKVMDDFVSRSQAVLSNDANLLCDVPLYVPHSYNGELVFAVPWDFGSQAAIRCPGKIARGWVGILNSEYVRNKIIVQDGCELVFWDGLLRLSADDLWCYRYDLKKKCGELIRVRDQEHLSILLKTVVN